MSQVREATNNKIEIVLHPTSYSVLQRHTRDSVDLQKILGGHEVQLYPMLRSNEAKGGHSDTLIGKYSLFLYSGKLDVKVTMGRRNDWAIRINGKRVERMLRDNGWGMIRHLPRRSKSGVQKIVHQREGELG